MVTLSQRSSRREQITSRRRERDDAACFRCNLCARSVMACEVLLMRRSVRALWRVVCLACANRLKQRRPRL